MPVDAARLDLAGRRVLVAGLGLSGRAATQALTVRDAAVTTLDARSEQADLHDDAAADHAREHALAIERRLVRAFGSPAEIEEVTA